MDIFSSLQSDKIKLLDYLDSLFLTPSLDNITQLPDHVDYFLVEELKRFIVRYATHIFQSSDSSESTLIFKVKGVQIHIDSAQILGSSQLVIAMLVRSLEVDDAGRKMREITERLPGTGAYSTVIFQVPTLLKYVDEKILKNLAVEIFSLGYNWLSERIITSIRRACDNTNRALYEYLRIMVPDRRILEGFVFSAAVQDKDFVVLDDVATRSALELASKRSEQFGRSAASMTLQMMLEVVPLSDSVIRDVMQQDGSIDIDLSAETYYQQGDEGFSDSLKAVWGNTVSCFPIVTSGKFFLVAFFMTQYKSELEPLLKAHRQRLCDIANGHAQDILVSLKLVSAAKEGNFEKAGDIAEIAGRFLGGIFHVPHN